MILTIFVSIVEQQQRIKQIILLSLSKKGRKALMEK